MTASPPLVPAGHPVRAALLSLLQNDGYLLTLIGAGGVRDDIPGLATGFDGEVLHDLVKELPLPCVALGFHTDDDGLFKITIRAWSRDGGFNGAHVLAGAVLQAIGDGELQADDLVSMSFALADIRRIGPDIYQSVIRLTVALERARVIETVKGTVGP